MFSAFKKLTKGGDDRCPAPMPMSSSLQKKFSRGVHFNMKILIKGDRNVGKSCLLQRLQGGPFIEDYAPTDQIQVAPIHWTYKNTDFIVKVEVWEVVDKGRTKKKLPLGLKLENQATPVSADEGNETPVLDATFLDVYKNANGVILMLDITKPWYVLNPESVQHYKWTFEYVIKELSRVPADLPVVILGNHCDMQHHRQVHAHHIEQAMSHAKMTRTAPIRYAESSMRNGFGLRLLHKFLSVPFLRLQKTSLLEQLQRNQKNMEEIEKDLDEFQNSEEAHYNLFLDRLANKRRQSAGAAAETRLVSERSPSIVIGAGKPIIPPDVNPLLAQSLNPKGIKAQHVNENKQIKQTQYVSPELLKPRHSVSMDTTPSRHPQGSGQSTPTAINVSGSSGGLDEFYAGTLDSSFLEDLTPMAAPNQETSYETDSDDGNTTNPMVTFDEDDLEVDAHSAGGDTLLSKQTADISKPTREFSDDSLRDKFIKNVNINSRQDIIEKNEIGSSMHSDHSHSQLSLDNDFPLWAGDSSARRSPEGKYRTLCSTGNSSSRANDIGRVLAGGEDPDINKEPEEKVKKHKKKKSKSKEKGDDDDLEQREKKHKHKKLKSDKRKSAQQDLLAPSSTSTGTEFNYEEYDSI